MSNMTAIDVQKVITQYVVIKLTVSKWSGRKKLNQSDIKGDNTKIPPRHIASLGIKRVYNDEKLKIFDKIKNEAIDILLAVGTRIPEISSMAFMIPEEELPGVRQMLENVSKRYMDTVQDEFKDYDKNFQQLINENPEWADIIQHGKVPKDEVVRKFKFKFRAFKIGLLNEDIHHADNADIHAIAKSTFDDYVNRVVDIMQEKVEKSFPGKDKINQKTMNGVRSALSILQNLALLDDCVQPTIRLLSSVISRMPKKGHIEFQYFALLKDTCKLLSAHDNVLNVNGVVDAFKIDAYLQQQGIDDQLHNVTPITSASTVEEDAVDDADDTGEHEDSIEEDPDNAEDNSEADDCSTMVGKYGL